MIISLGVLLMQRISGRRQFPTHILVFLAPAVLLYTLFMVYPLLDSLRLSFYTLEQNEEVFNGLGNYVTLFTNPNYAPRFWGALINNIEFFAIHMLVQNSIGLLLAALLVEGGIGRRLYRTVLFMPTVLSVVIIGFIWQLILNPLWGVTESILEAVGLGELFKPWLGLPSTALPTVSLISVWQFVGIPMILFYTALIAIPEVIKPLRRGLRLSTFGVSSSRSSASGITHPDLRGELSLTRFTMKGANAGLIPSGFIFFTDLLRPAAQLGVPPSTVAAMMFLIILTGVLIYMFLWQRRIQTYEL
jgi:raffinose/stachyose/melibiose transport system permease protein